MEPMRNDAFIFYTFMLIIRVWAAFLII